MRLLDHFGLVPILEAKDYGSAGASSDSWKMDKAASVAIVLNFGAITGDSTLLIYGGATLAAATTALAYRYRLATGVFAAVASADQYDAAVAQAASALTLTAATFKNRTMVIDIDAAELADTKPYLTVVVSATATVLLMAGFAVLGLDRYKPALTNIV